MQDELKPTIYVMFSNVGTLSKWDALRKWDVKPFEGGIRYDLCADMGRYDPAAMIEGARIALEAAAHLSDRNAKWAEEAFRKELILKNSDRQTHYAARNREAKELAASIRALDPTQLIKEQTDAE